MNKILLFLKFKKYNIYIWSSFFITFILLFLQLIISIYYHKFTKNKLKNIYQHDKNN